MSTTYKSRLEAVSSSLDTAIATANSLPEAGSGSGGASVETCTVRLVAGGSDPSYGNLVQYCAIDGEDNAIFYSEYGTGVGGLANYYVTLSNVKCGSILSFSVVCSAFGYMEMATTIDGDGELLFGEWNDTHTLVKIGGAQGDVITITSYFDEE